MKTLVHVVVFPALLQTACGSQWLPTLYQECSPSRDYSEEVLMEESLSHDASVGIKRTSVPKGKRCENACQLKELSSGDTKDPVLRDHLDDPLDDTATVFQQLEQLCTVSRCEYEKTCTLLVQLFDQNAQDYQKLLHSATGITVDMAIQEDWSIAGGPYPCYCYLKQRGAVSLLGYECVTMMSVLMNTIVFEDCRNQWSVSRPLLGLVLLNEKYFGELRASLINSQPLPRQEVLAQCFRNLMEGVEQNLSIKNRDRFTQNLSVFRRDVAEALRSDSSAELCRLDMMS
ncbi:Ran-binding protein 17 [Tupaia chinensis]|uniref:Ran-binding protein 17 n=1 Tax=Tupaia chinensis TaxID=246437 RepID=L9KU45_TUPCH|nr:Ran-binding protein 17 [Tupaia chinensis]